MVSGIYYKLTALMALGEVCGGTRTHQIHSPPTETQPKPNPTIIHSKPSFPPWIRQAVLRSTLGLSVELHLPSHHRPSLPTGNGSRSPRYLPTAAWFLQVAFQSRTGSCRLTSNAVGPTQKQRQGAKAIKMAPKLPAQQLVVSPDKHFLVLAISFHLQLVDRATGIRLRSTEDAGLNPPDSNHTGLIRLLLIHQDHNAPDKPQILVSTGEDKLLKIWQLPDLKLLHSRQLIKRATSIAVSPNGKNIVIADKFGDVYDLPFDAPSQTVFQSDPDQEETPASTVGHSSAANETDSKADEKGSKPVTKAIAPIAGHVSVLTSLAFIPSQPNPLLVTADRDEHIRISRYPQAWSIERYLLGHRKFVGALLWLPHPSDPERGQGRLLSAGGDDALFVWDHLRGLATQTIDLSGLAKGLKVCPAKQAWFSKARTNKRRRPNTAEETKTVPVGTEPPSVPPHAEDKLAVEDESSAVQEVCTETSTEPQQVVQKTCVNKIIYTSPSDLAGPGYVLVTSVGSSTIAYIPLPRIFDSDPELAQNTRYLDLDLPVLDLAVLSPDLVLVSLDSTFSSDPSLPSSSSFRILSLTPDKIEEVSDPKDFNLACLNESGSIESSNGLALPSQELLYPELLLFTKDTPGSVAQEKKAHHANRNVGSGGRSGKKGEGRLVSQARCEIVLAKAAIS